MNITDTGIQGTAGVSNTNPGQSGTAGGPGQSLNVTLASGPSDTDAANTLTVNGGTGGVGGLGGLGGSGGAGGDGGDATAIVSTTVADSTSASATANGGSGQVGGSASGGTDGHGGAAGSATSSATVSSSQANAGTIEALSTAIGGTAGEALPGTLADNGGAATATASAVATGAGTNALASVVQIGGEGGFGAGNPLATAPGGSAGAGADSTLNNAVSGSTNGGELTLDQEAWGGAGGTADQGAGGAAGNGSSTLTASDTTSTVLNGTVTAKGGSGGSSGVDNGQDGGTATSSINLSGAESVVARANADGGGGGFGGGQGVPGPQNDPTSGGNYPGNGGNGGNASANATGISVVTGNVNPALASVTVTVQSVGGNGNSGSDANFASGSGGTAAAVALGSSNIAATVDVSVEAVGGNGGNGNNFEAGTFGEGPANGGNGATTILTDAVSGVTNGGELEFNETAYGGNGGNSAGGTVGTAGAGTASLTFDDTRSATQSALVNATVTGVGGVGGSGTGGAAGANGAAAIGNLSITGSKAVDATAYATGQQGGTGTTVDGAGGSATATAVGIGGTVVQSVADATGGEGQGTSAAGTAVAMSTAQGASGTVRSLASSSDVGPVAITAVSALATATVTGSGTGGAVAATAGTAIGGSAAVVPGGQQAVAVVDALPSAATVSAALGSNSAIDFELGNGATPFVLGQLSASANGMSVTQTETASVTMTVNTAMVAPSGQVLVGLFGGAPTGSFTSMTFSVAAGGIQLLTETFTSVAAADAFFDDNVLDLGSDTKGALAGTPSLSFNLSVTEDTAGAGYSLGVSGAGIGVGGSSIAPIIVGTVAGQTTTSEAPVDPFSSVTVEDPNLGATDTLTITFAGADGSLAGVGLTGSNGSYQLTGTAAVITSELRSLVFTPVDGIPNTSVTTTFTLSDLSSAVATPTVDGITTVIDSDPAVAPAIAGTVAGQNTTAEAPLSPFSKVTITDANNGGTDTDTLAITLTGSGGTLAGTGLSGSAGNYSLTGTAAIITGELDGLTFTPGAAGTTMFKLSDQSSAFATATVDTTTTVIDTDLATAPSITGAVSGQATTSEATIAPFSGVTITDTNNGGADTDTLSITFAGGDGTLSGTGLSGSAGNYSLTGTASVITGELAALIFTPVDGVPNTSVTTTFTLSDLSSAFATATVNTGTSVIDTDPAVAPTISGTVAGQTTTSEAPVAPFSGVTIKDPDNNGTDTDTLTISFTGSDGALAGSGLTGSNGHYTLTGTAAVITGELDALTFTPVDGVPNTSVTTTFTLNDQSSATALAAVNSTATVIDSDPAVAPTIAGTVAGQTTTSDAPVTPFSGVTVTDANNGGGDNDTLTITLSGSGGTLSGTGLSGSSGTYTLSGTATAITTELRALTFTPGGAGTTTFSLSDLSSAFAVPVANNTTTVTDSDTTVVAPTISGTVSGQATVDHVPVNPFATVSITDAVAGVDSLTIVLKNAGGVATDANGLLSGAGLTKTGVGTYTFAATNPAALTNELKALTFTPTQAEVTAGKTVTTSFTLSASEVEGAATASATNSATTVVVTALNYVTGPAGGFGVLVGTAGQDVITAHGYLNAIYGEGGADFINAGSGIAYVDVAGGSATVTLGGGLNDVVGTNGNVTVTGGPGGLNSVTLGNGNNVVKIGGQDDVIRLGNGNNLVSGTQGMAFITTGSGNDTIMVAGTGNTINAGGGANVIQGGAGNDTFVLPPASTGFDTITGFTELNGDVLDLRSALAATGWNHQTSTLGNYLKVTDNGGSTTIAIASTGRGTGVAIGVLSGSGNLGLTDLLGHRSLLTM